MPASQTNGLKKHLWGIIVLLLTQSAAAIWWASAITVRMAHCEQNIDGTTSRLDDHVTFDLRGALSGEP